jgi:alkylation response protein AidB-like acyl-CoA dehydrogenase
MLTRPRQWSADEAGVEACIVYLSDALQIIHKVSRSLRRPRVSSGSVSAPESMAGTGAMTLDRYELRRLDYSLSQDHVDVQAAYRQFFSSHCSIETVRAAEPSGFDKSLWERLCAMGATTMALPESSGGDGGTLVDLVLVAEELGRVIAPVPWIDHVCTTRLLARMGVLQAGQDRTNSLVSGEQLAGLDPQLGRASGVRLISSGSVADHVVVRDGDDVVLLSFDSRPAKVDNIGRLPMAWVDPAVADSRVILTSGAAGFASYQTALDEWRLLMAAALVGLVEETMTIAAEFAKTRYTMGVPISTLQGISHPLANMAITVAGGRNLARRAAWFLDNEPDERPELAASAFVFMAEEASKAATMAVHVQGGLGVSAEAPASAYLLRARGWPLAAGDPGASASHIADVVAARESRTRTSTPATQPVHG